MIISGTVTRSNNGGMYDVIQHIGTIILLNAATLYLNAV